MVYNGGLISVKVKTSDQIRDELEFLQSKLDCCLVIDGESLQACCAFLLICILLLT